MIKYFLQTLVVRSNFGPFACLYRGCYALALNKIVHVLKKQPDILSVYLIASMAADDYVPGLSDIDLMIIVKDAKKGMHKVKICHQQLCNMVPFLKSDEPSIYSLEEIKRSYTQSDFYLKYKLFTECKNIGKLLHGMDILRDFQELDAPRKNESMIGQLEFTWSIFLKNFLIENRTTAPLIQNYLCYKLTSDMCKVSLSTAYGQNILTRKKSLECALPHLDAEDTAHVAAITKLAEQRFFGYQPHLLENTYDFCIKAILNIIEHVHGIPTGDEDQKASNPKYCDLASLDLIISDENKRTIDMFVKLIKEKYGKYISSVLVSPVDLFHLEEQNIGIFITPKQHIPLGIINEFNAMLKVDQDHPQQLYLYLATHGLAISLNKFTPGIYHSAIFPFQWMSFTLLYLSTPAAAFLGKPYHDQDSKKIVTNYFWHHTTEAITQDEIAIRKLINDKDIVRISTIEFQRFFWQAVRLKLIQNSLNSGTISIPLSSAQVCQCYRSADLNPLWFKEFHEEYKKDLCGSPSNSGSYFPEALTVLKKMYP